MKYFGTDGFRGVAGTDLTVEHAYKIGRFIGWYYGARQGRKAVSLWAKTPVVPAICWKAAWFLALLLQVPTLTCCTLFLRLAFRTKLPMVRSIAA